MSRRSWKCIGHRGVPSLHPENTLRSFKAALDDGADGIELDVRLTRDNQVIVLHDRTLDRTTDGKGEVEEANYMGYIDGLRTRNTHLGYLDCFRNSGTKNNFAHTTSSISAQSDTTSANIKILNSIADTMPITHIEALDQSITSQRDSNNNKLVIDSSLAAPTGELTDEPVPLLVEILDWMLGLNRPLQMVIDVKNNNPLSIMDHLTLILAKPAYASLLPRITIGIWSPFFIGRMIELRRFNNSQLAPIRRSLITPFISFAKLFVFMGAVDHVSLMKNAALTNKGWIIGMKSLNYLTVEGDATTIPTPESSGSVKTLIERFIGYFNPLSYYRYWNNVQRSSISISVWTVDKEEDMQTLVDLGVDELLTNSVAKCVSFRNSPSHQQETTSKSATNNDSNMTSNN